MEKMMSTTGTYMTSYWNIMAAVAIVPFKLQWDPFQNEFVASSSLPQKILCMGTGTCNMIVSIWWIIGHLTYPTKIQSQTASETVLSIFTFLMSLFSVLKGACFMNIIWMRKRTVLEVVTLFQTSTQLPGSPVYYRLQISILFVLMLAQLTFNLMAVSTSVFLQKMGFQCAPDSSVQCAFLLFRGYSWMILNVIGMIFLTAVNFIFYSFVLSLRSVAIWYENECFLRSSSPKSVSNNREMLQKRISMYYGVKTLTKKANKLMGNLTFGIYLELLLYFANGLGVYSDLRSDTWGVLHFISITSFTITFWVLVCEFHQKIHSTTCDWTELYNVDGNISMEERLRLLTLSDEIATTPIGISCRFFHVTYGFLGSTIGLIITYAIIILQMSPQETAPVN